MKKTLLALITISIIPSTVLANESKNGVYISAKMGASILQMKGQFYPYTNISTELAEKQKGDNHRTAVFGTGLALGYDFYDNFNLPVRAELDFTSRAKADYNYSKFQENSFFSVRNTIKNQIEANTLMFNAYYDFKNSSDFTPYLSAGLGYAYISQKTSQIGTVGTPGGGNSTETLQTRSHATNNFAWSAGAGIKYKVSQDFSFDLSYKYLDAGQAEVDYLNPNGVETNAKTKVRTHDIMLSATYHF